MGPSEAAVVYWGGVWLTACPPLTTFVRAIYCVGLWSTEREAWEPLPTRAKLPEIPLLYSSLFLETVLGRLAFSPWVTFVLVSLSAGLPRDVELSSQASAF